MFWCPFVWCLYLWEKGSKLLVIENLETAAGWDLAHGGGVEPGPGMRSSYQPRTSYSGVFSTIRLAMFRLRLKWMDPTRDGSYSSWTGRIWRSQRGTRRTPRLPRSRGAPLGIELERWKYCVTFPYVSPGVLNGGVPDLVSSDCDVSFRSHLFTFDRRPRQNLEGDYVKSRTECVRQK